jgi:hypothetical protein
MLNIKQTKHYDDSNRLINSIDLQDPRNRAQFWFDLEVLGLFKPFGDPFKVLSVSVVKIFFKKLKNVVLIRDITFADEGDDNMDFVKIANELESEGNENFEIKETSVMTNQDSKSFKISEVIELGSLALVYFKPESVISSPLFTKIGKGNVRNGNEKLVLRVYEPTILPYSGNLDIQNESEQDISFIFLCGCWEVVSKF